jgi:hypothetical protein
MSTEISTLSAQVGSVSHVANNLITWIAHRRPGIVWVEFLSDEIRDLAIEQVNANCRTAKTPVRRIEMQSAFSRRDWEQVRDQIESAAGVVNVLFPALFNPDLLEPGSFRDFALALNLDRERIFSANALQIWWISRPLSAILRPFAPDFVSWVHARFTLSELPPSVANATSHLELVTQINRGGDGASISLQHRSPDSNKHVADNDPRLVEPHELLLQSEQLLTAGKLKEALALAGEAVYGFRQELSIGEAAQSGLATALDLLARIQARLGQRQQALASSAEAVRHYRVLAEANPDAFLPDLARSLNNQANMQSDMGQRFEALASIAEAVRLRRTLAEADPDAFLPALAASLNNLATMQSEVGQRAEALETAREAVKLYGEWAGQNRAAFLPDLAMSLNNLATMQSAVGQRAEALETAREAVKLYGELAGQNRAAFLPALAGSLNNLATMQSAVGQRAEALETAREAVTFRRELAGQNRAALLPNLASSLNNLANRQSAVGQRAEALASITEAVHHYRALAETNPDAFLPDLARSLSVQGDILAALGRPLEAHDAASEALVYLAPSFERYPDVFDDLAKLTLHAYLLRTQALGEEPEDSLLIPYRELLKTESTGSAATPPKKDHSQF